MRIRHLLSFVVVITAGILACDVPSACAAKIEATKGKTYNLTKQHGPWMIMVATFGARLDVDTDNSRSKSRDDASRKAAYRASKEETDEQLKNADVAARELVFELRQKGIPAYIYSQKGALSEVESMDRFGQRAHRFEAAQRSRICVIAGNYPSVEDKTAEATLKYIKSLAPKSLANGTYKKTKNSPGPLSRAFLTLNPLLSQEEIAERGQMRDPLLLKLNAGSDYTLMENDGKFTLVVASFVGNSQIQLMSKNNGGELAQRIQSFDQKLKETVKLAKYSPLDTAGRQAWELVNVMRAQGIEAYVYHDRYKSIVTVGAFQSEKDPRIPDLYRKFSAKYKYHPETKKEELVAEAIKVGEDPNNPERSWVMDPKPQLFRVPRLN